MSNKSDLESFFHGFRSKSPEIKKVKKCRSQRRQQGKEGNKSKKALSQRRQAVIEDKMSRSQRS